MAADTHLLLQPFDVDDRPASSLLYCMEEGFADFIEVIILTFPFGFKVNSTHTKLFYELRNWVVDGLIIEQLTVAVPLPYSGAVYGPV